MAAVAKGVQTKIANGTANNMSVNTAIKGAVSSQASDLYRTVTNTVLDLAKSLYNVFNNKK